MRPDVEAWFRSRTSLTSWWPRDLLIELKGATTVSVVLPALDEEATVGPIVAAVNRHLVAVGLVDELVVMDSGSTDATAMVAAAAGAEVVATDDVLPQLGSLPGKGESLWKALHVTSGDVVVYVDADLHDFSPAFVTGLIGPLLGDPDVAYVKALYERPLSTTAGVVPAGGGRVTELVARPVLNALWPQLAGIVQPLAGEYAGRREVLERVPFASGYGVEIGLLVDLLALVGLDGFAQVDLGVRTHRHQSDAALGRMAGQVWQTLLRRLPTTAPEASPVLQQFVRTGEGRFEPQPFDVSTVDRPPMATVAEYLEQHPRAGAPAVRG